MGRQQHDARGAEPLTKRGFGRLLGALLALVPFASGVFASVQAGAVGGKEIRILLSAYRNDNIAACGCAGNQVGGIANETTLVRGLRRSSTEPLYLVDLGPTGASRETAGAFAQYFKRMGFVAVAPRAAEGAVQSAYDDALARAGLETIVHAGQGVSLVPLKGSPHFFYPTFRATILCGTVPPSSACERCPPPPAFF